MRCIYWRKAVTIGCSVGACTGLFAALGLEGSAIGAPNRSATPTKGTLYVSQAPKPSENPPAGSLIYESGFDYDQVLGANAFTFVVKPLPGVTGKILVKAKAVTLWTATGSLRGTGSGVLTITNKPNPGDATVTDGMLLLNHGTGGMAGHSLRVTFSGAGSIGTPGTPDFYTFHYKGVYR